MHYLQIKKKKKEEEELGPEQKKGQAANALIIPESFWAVKSVWFP